MPSPGSSPAPAASAETIGLWARAAAFLGRQSLEDAMSWVWIRRAPGLESCPARAQLLCLGPYLGDEELAESAAYVYGRLSSACHHHAYELAPTADELRAWLSAVDRLMSAAGAVSGAGPDASSAPDW